MVKTEGMPEASWITGKSGFIGSALNERLATEGQAVYGLSRDILPLPNTKPDYVYYIASYGNYHDQTDKTEIFQANSQNFCKLLSEIKDDPPKMVVYFSSSSVYGFHPHRLNEETALLGDTYYAKAKIAGELWAKHFSEFMPVSIIRPFSVTGVGEQDRHLIPTAIKAAFSGEILNLDPLPCHDYVDVFDLLEALRIVVKNHKYLNKLTTFNVCSGKQYSNEQVVELVEKITGKRIKVNYVDGLRKYDSRHWLGDNSRMQALGWYPKIMLEDSITHMVQEYKDGRKSGDQKNRS